MGTELHYSTHYGYTLLDWLHRCSFERMYEETSVREGVLDFDLDELLS